MLTSSCWVNLNAFSHKWHWCDRPNSCIRLICLRSAFLFGLLLKQCGHWCGPAVCCLIWNANELLVLKNVWHNSHWNCSSAACSECVFFMCVCKSQFFRNCFAQNSQTRFFARTAGNFWWLRLMCLARPSFVTKLFKRKCEKWRINRLNLDFFTFTVDIGASSDEKISKKNLHAVTLITFIGGKFRAVRLFVAF